MTYLLNTQPHSAIVKCIEAYLNLNIGIFEKPHISLILFFMIYSNWQAYFYKTIISRTQYKTL